MPSTFDLAKTYYQYIWLSYNEVCQAQPDQAKLQDLLTRMCDIQAELISRTARGDEEAGFALIWLITPATALAY